MRGLSRLTLAAALIALPLARGLAQEATAPSLGEDGDFSVLRGAEGTASVPVPAATVPKPVPDEEPAKPLRIQRQQPIVTYEGEEPPKARKPVQEDESYDPLGIRIGSFILLPSVELRGGLTSNAAGDASGRSAGIGTIAPDITLKSDWGRHELSFNLRGSYDTFTDKSVDPRPALTAEADARLDLPREWTLKLKGAYDYSTQSLSSIDYPSGVDKPPGINAYTAAATLDGRLGHTVLQLRGSAVHTQYDDGQAGGTVIPQGDRDNTFYSGAVRVGYEVSPAITPFVETEVSRRNFDERIDSNGFRRASSGFTLRGGIAYSSDPILSGELAIGWHHEVYDDGNFRSLDAPTIDGSIIWSPTALTKFTLKASTSTEPTTDPNSSGAIVYSTSLKAEHALRRNVTIEGDLGWSREHYEGIGETDITYQAGFGVTWKINREAWLLGRLEQDYYASSTPGSSYPTTTATVGLKLQR